MDIEGIDVAVLYPTRGLRALVVDDMEAGFAAAIARAYNNWLADFCQKDPHRLIGAGMISPYNINDAVDEARRCAKNSVSARFFCEPTRSLTINGTTITMSRFGVPWKRSAYPWDFTNPLALANARSASDWSPISCSAGFMPSRWNKCWPSEVFAPPGYLPAIQN